MQYQTIYDVAQEGISTEQSGMVFFFFVGIVFGLILLRSAVQEREKLKTKFIAFWLVGWVSIGGCGAAVMLSQRMQYIRWLQSGDFDVVEGIVTDFVPGSFDGRQPEQFTVGGVQFNYTFLHLGETFNQIAARGGPIYQGLQVRIAYREGCILKLEMAK